MLMRELGLTEAQVAKRVKGVLPPTYDGPQVNQQWVSRRLTDGPSSVRLTIEDAILIAEALGQTAEFVIAPKGTAPLVNAAANAHHETVGLAIQLMQGLGALAPEDRNFVVSTVRLALARSAAVAAR